MPSQPATKQDLKAFFTDDLKPHFDRKVEEVKAYTKRTADELTTHVRKEIQAAHAATADELADIKATLDDHTAKLNRLLTDTRVENLEQRVASIEHALYGDRR